MSRAAGGSGARAKPKARSNVNVPQEIVTPTRRDMHTPNLTANIDWLPVSEFNSRSNLSQARKPINIHPENNEYADLEAASTSEATYRFVPVRPQPRTLVLRQMENQDDASYPATVGAHASHTNHAAVMIVNPTTPNNGINGHSNKNLSRSGSSCRDGNNSCVNNAVTVGPYPINNNKYSNLSSDNQEFIHPKSTMQNVSNENLTDTALPRSRVTRLAQENMTCPEASHVEQRLGQIQEYIRVTASLVDSMRNSEDEDFDRDQSNDINELLQTLSNLRDSEVKLNDLLCSTLKSIEVNAGSVLEKVSSPIVESPDDLEVEKEHESCDLVKIQSVPDVSDCIHQEVLRSSSVQSGGSAYSDNDLWQSELEPKMDVSQINSLREQKYMLKCQGTPVCRSSSRERDLADGSEYCDSSEIKTLGLSSTVPDIPEMDMLRDLQIRRQHLESQVLKIQNLQAATTTLVEAVADGGLSSDNKNLQNNGGWEVSESGAIEDDCGVRNLRNKMAAVNVVKVELERLNNMLRTVDSIQSNFGLNPTSDDDNSCDGSSLAALENINRKRSDQNRLSESSFNNIPSFKSDSPLSSKSNQSINNQGAKNRNTSQSLPKLQNCVSSGSSKCTNVYDQQDSICAGLATIQHLTQQMKHEAQEINDVRQSLKHAFISGVNNYSTLSTTKSDEKKKTNSSSKTNSFNQNYPTSLGPLERKQQALKIELEAKKKQLERLMSKEVDHSTNQHSAYSDANVSTRSVGSSCDREIASQDLDSTSPLPNLLNQKNSGRMAEGDYSDLISSEVDIEYASDQEENAACSQSCNTQMNVNQLNSSHKLPSVCSSPDNFKVGDYNDTQLIMENMMQNKHSHANIFGASTSMKQRNKELVQIKNDEQEIPVQDMLQEHRTSGDIFHNQRAISEPIEESKPEAVRDPNILPMPQSFERFSKISSIRNSTLPPSKQMTMRDKSVAVNGHADTETCSQLDSQSSNGDQELTDMPRPMPAMSLRNTLIKDEQVADSENLDHESQRWYNPHLESQITMWWHNKANQLQQQLEMTNNLCQSLLQDRRPSQTSPSTLNSIPQTLGNANFLIPNNPGPVMLPYGYGNLWNGGNMNEQLSGSWWMVMQQQQLALQQQQLAAQQQQLAANSWANNQCIQNILSQHREISTLQSVINNLEEKYQALNVNTPRSHSTPPINNPNDQGNSALSRSQLHQWNISAQLPVNQPDNVLTNESPLIYINRQNSHCDRISSAKKPPSVPPYPMDNTNSNVPLNFYPTPYLNEQINSHVNMATITPNNLPMENQNNMIFNNVSPSMHLHPNILNHQPISQPIHNNMNLINMHGSNQTLEGQNTALNNQVPPGNRANNYWDNFRSYSRQNLLSGNNKINSESSLQTHSPLPLSERSHNSFHSGPSGMPPTLLSVTTPKQNINNQLGNAAFNHLNNNPNMQINYSNGNVRGRRNLPNESTLNAPPDVLNINQNLDPRQNHNALDASINPEENNTVNQIAHASGVNSATNCTKPHSNGALKKKSSTKLPAKNCANHSLECVPDKNVHSTQDQSNQAIQNSPLTNSSVGQKSATKLFDLLRDNIYAEVFALINANESRPHFLIQLFRDLQQISSDTLRQKTLQSIHELVTGYLSSIDMVQSHKNNVVTSTSEEAELTENSDVGIFTLDVDNDILKFITIHNSDIFNDDLFKALRNLVFSIVKSCIDQNQLDKYLFDNLKRYSGCKLIDISNDLVIILSRIILNKKEKQSKNKDSIGSVACEIKSEDDKFNNESAENACGVGDSGNLCTRPVSNSPSCSIDVKSPGVCSLHSSSELKIDLINNVDICNGDLAEADQSRHTDDMNNFSVPTGFDTSLPDIVDMDEQTPTEAEAGWLKIDRTSQAETENSDGNEVDNN